MISELSGYRLPKVLTPEARLENPVRMRRKHRRQRNFDGRRISPLAIIQRRDPGLGALSVGNRDRQEGRIHCVLKRFAAALGVSVDDVIVER
jgi:hypothetical protein